MGTAGFYGSNRTSYDADPVDFTLRFTAGAAGAVPAQPFTKGSSGIVSPIASVTHGANGVYDVTLTEVWADWIKIGGIVIQASYSAAGACNVQCIGVDLPNKVVHLLITTAAGASVAMASGDIINVNFTMQNQANY